MSLFSGTRSRNPFRSNPTTPNGIGDRDGSGSPVPNITTNASSSSGNNNGPEASVPVVDAPAYDAASLSPPLANNSTAPRLYESPLRETDMEDPPPYTPMPSSQTGEMVLEHGPNRPFQPPPPRRASPNPPPRPQPVWQSSTPGTYSSSSLPASSPTRPSPGALLHQMTSSISNIVNNTILSPSRTDSGLSPQATGHSNWSSYPGRNTHSSPQIYPPPSGPPPPRHPLSPSVSPTRATLTPQSSDFAREFYAAGTGDGLNLVEGQNPPSPSSPRSHASPSSGRPPPPHNDGRPTTRPALGHPLLKDGKLLVYPKGYECDKCHNVGYKNSDPLRPCKRCWGKYSKNFAGPLTYSYSSTSTAENFQRPLTRIPPPAPPPIPPAVSLNPPSAHFAPGGYVSNRHGGFSSPPTGVTPILGRPPPNAVVYRAGDPRIGGRPCWRCDGKGNVSLLFLDRTTCEVCGGVGRVF